MRSALAVFDENKRAVLSVPGSLAPDLPWGDFSSTKAPLHAAMEAFERLMGYRCPLHLIDVNTYWEAPPPLAVLEAKLSPEDEEDPPEMWGRSVVYLIRANRDSINHFHRKPLPASGIKPVWVSPSGIYHTGEDVRDALYHFGLLQIPTPVKKGKVEDVGVLIYRQDDLLGNMDRYQRYMEALERETVLYSSRKVPRDDYSYLLREAWGASDHRSPVGGTGNGFFYIWQFPHWQVHCTPNQHPCVKVSYNCSPEQAVSAYEMAVQHLEEAIPLLPPKRDPSQKAETNGRAASKKRSGTPEKPKGS